MVIAVTNLKGGVGKSTISRNIAACFADQGAKACIVDTDIEQRTTCDWVARRVDAKIHVPVFPIGNAATLVTDIRNHARDGYNMIIVDGVPQTDEIATRTILVSDLLLIPITPSIDDLKSFERFLKRFEEVRISRNDKVPAYLILNKFGGRSNEDREVREALQLFEQFDIHPMQATLADRVAHRTASKYGLTAYEYTDDKARTEVVALCDEITEAIANLNQAKALAQAHN